MKKLKYGNTNTYFIDGLLFDTDMPGMMQPFFKAIKEAGVQFNSIKYVIASHYHPDHIGLVSELMDMGVKLIIVEHQLPYVHFADEILGRQSGAKYKPIDETKAVVISVNESRAFLKSIGINGEIIPTHSHSSDGIALLLDDGNCLVGDLEPRSYIGAYDNNATLTDDWERVMEHAPRIICFGHAKEKNIV